MYSLEWFETFAATVPAAAARAELDGITAICPPDRYPRLLELGCGTGRVTGPLARLGYRVVGLDINTEALRTAQRAAPGPQYVALDQRNAGKMAWRFDAALILWNSLGFVDRSADLEMLSGLSGVLRPGGKLILDLYHPGWLEHNQHSGTLDPRGARLSRWLKDGRCFHEICYPDGAVDHMAFNVYDPAEMSELVLQAGLRPQLAMVWWDPLRQPSAEQARYELVCERPG